MDFELKISRNWLKIWRESKSLSPETVDQILSWPAGRTRRYESRNLLRIPCCDLAALARVYRIPAQELLEIIWVECEKIRTP
ncbi:MAG: hypothetical protein JNL11_03375 [Bdellovibrionaceae bacterium]|nr:hypothetical protein [Pseudobdellovibrionaceae bacterium]